ncbi:MAG: hypothetical protein M5U25_09035 [Planctomycetota bacterium]|nr:hypothetical protein [Planctomycetota bacterium]
MEYDGTGLKAGVQFQCTQCGGMVQVGAPRAKGKTAGPRAAGGPRPAGGPRAAGGPARGGARGRPAAGGSPMGQMQAAQQKPGYGPPKKGSNAGVFVGIGVGVIALVIVLAAVFMGSGPAPEDLAKQKAEEDHKRHKEEMAKKDAEVAAENEAKLKPINALMQQGPSIEAALRNGDAATLEALFDWNAYASYNANLIAGTWGGNMEYKEAALICVGDWVRDADGAPTGSFMGKAAHGADGLRQRVMEYIKEFYFGAQDIKWEKARTEAHAGNSVTVGSTVYLTKPIYISFKGSGPEKEFWLGAPKGSGDVRIVNFIDKGAFTKLQEKEAPRQRKVDDRDPRNPDRDPRNPDRDPASDPGSDPIPGMEDPPANPDDNLPNVAKIGTMPTEPALVNAVNELKNGGKLNAQRISQIKGEPNKDEKKATMGALVDLLIDAVNSKDRTAKLNISTALHECFKFLAYVGWEKEELVYSIGFEGQSESDIIVRRWIELYNSYKPE